MLLRFGDPTCPLRSCFVDDPVTSESAVIETGVPGDFTFRAGSATDTERVADTKMLNRWTPNYRQHLKSRRSWHWNWGVAQPLAALAIATGVLLLMGR